MKAGQPVNEDDSTGGRVREVRKRRGLTQRELSRLSGVSLSLITKLESGEYGHTRLETLHKLAAVLGVPTSALTAERDAPVPARESAAVWEPVRRVLEGAPGAEPAGEPTLEGVRSAVRGTLPLLLASRFAEMGTVLPALLRDADALVACSADGTVARQRPADRDVGDRRTMLGADPPGQADGDHGTRVPVRR